MFYPIALEPGDEKTAWGVIVPDIKGCFSAGDTLDEAISNAKEAIELVLEVMAEKGQEPPEASAVQNWQKAPEYAGFIWAVIEVDTAQFSGKTERFNVTLPARLVSKIDLLVSTDQRYKSRSAFLAFGAERLIQQSR